MEIPECTIKPAQAGSHIIQGKPMAMTVGRATDMVRVVEEAGITCVPWPEM